MAVAQTLANQLFVEFSYIPYAVAAHFFDLMSAVSVVRLYHKFAVFREEFFKLLERSVNEIISAYIILKIFKEVRLYCKGLLICRGTNDLVKFILMLYRNVLVYFRPVSLIELIIHIVAVSAACTRKA